MVWLTLFSSLFFGMMSTYFLCIYIYFHIICTGLIDTGLDLSIPKLISYQKLWFLVGIKLFRFNKSFLFLQLRYPPFANKNGNGIVQRMASSKPPSPSPSPLPQTNTTLLSCSFVFSKLALIKVTDVRLNFCGFREIVLRCVLIATQKSMCTSYLLITSWGWFGK